MKTGSPRRGRLSRSAEFDRVYRHGRSLANRQLVLYTFPNQANGEPRLGLSVSRKVGGAVERNRIKRLLRDAFAHVAPELSEGQDVVVLARPELSILAEREGLAGVKRSLAELLDRSGLRVGEDGTDRREAPVEAPRAAAPPGDAPRDAPGDAPPRDAPGDASGDAPPGGASGDAPRRGARERDAPPAAAAQEAHL
jgi:ribonuclease P protein component